MHMLCCPAFIYVSTLPTARGSCWVVSMVASSILPQMATHLCLSVSSHSRYDSPSSRSSHLCLLLLHLLSSCLYHYIFVISLSSFPDQGTSLSLFILSSLLSSLFPLLLHHYLKLDPPPPLCLTLTPPIHCPPS